MGFTLKLSLQLIALETCHRHDLVESLSSSTFQVFQTNVDIFHLDKINFLTMVRNSDKPIATIGWSIEILGTNDAGFFPSRGSFPECFPETPKKCYSGNPVRQLRSKNSPPSKFISVEFVLMTFWPSEHSKPPIGRHNLLTITIIQSFL